jgi:ribosome maturation factor RimP
MRDELTPELKALITKTLKTCGVELYDIEFKGRVLRVFIDHEEGVTIDMCVRVSEALSSELDKANLILRKYFLEVSSPGVERRLRHQRDFQKVLGKTITLETERGNYTGRLLKITEDGIVVENPSGQKEPQEVFITYENIKDAHLKVSTEELFGKTEPSNFCPKETKEE